MVLDFLHTHGVVSMTEAQHKQITQARIEETFQQWMSSGRCSEAVQKLEELQLLERYRTGHDTFVFLTPAGIRVAGRTAQAQVDSAAIVGTPVSGHTNSLVFDERGNPVGGR